MTVTVKNNPYNLTRITDTLIPLDKLNQSKALETGNVSSDKDIYADVLKYAHSTFDASKFTIVGTPTITDDGIASGFTARKSYVYIPCDLSSAKSWRIRIRQKFIDGNTCCPVSFYSALNNTSEIFRLQFNNVNQRLIVVGDTQHTILKQFPDLNTYYDFEISYNENQMSVETFKNSIVKWANFVYTLSRDKNAQGEAKNILKIHCLKDRYTGKADGLIIPIKYNTETCTLTELTNAEEFINDTENGDSGNQEEQEEF